LAPARRGLAHRVRTLRRRHAHRRHRDAATALSHAPRAPSLGVALRPPPLHRCEDCVVAVRSRVPGISRWFGDGRARLARVQVGGVRGLAWRLMPKATPKKRKRAVVRSAKRAKSNNLWYGI